MDYLQLMRSPQYAKDRVQEISDISRSLKALSRELEIPVIAISQLSRASEQRGGDRVPILSDLRDSGAIEQDADLVIFIHRPEMYYDLREKAEKDGRDLRGKAIVELAKNRNGPTGPINLYYRKEVTRFENFSNPPGGEWRQLARHPVLAMARPRSVYRCTECGHDHPKWVGKCEACGAWNAVAEEPVTLTPPSARSSRRTADPVNRPSRLKDIEESRLVRWTTGLPEFDFVLGSGIVPGSMTLVGGEPGIGKSTLLLQAAARLEASGRKVLYASGEESPEQIRAPRRTAGGGRRPGSRRG